MIEKYVNAEELKRLLQTLMVILGCLIIAGLFASIVVPGLRNANKPPTPTAVRPVVGQTGWLDPTEFPPEKGRVIPPVDPQTLLVSSPELLEQGGMLFEQNCLACHGELGQGDGPAASTMDPRPRNLAAPDGWVNGYGLAGMFKTLSEGIDGTSMNAFDYLSKKDRMALAHYVQSLGAFSHETDEPQAVEALSQELASPGEKTSNKIPVSMAMAKLENEFAPVASFDLDPMEENPGAAILRRVTADPARAAQILAASSAWRADERELAETVLADSPANGFSVEAATLSASEWKLLHRELLECLETE
jgi:mono/diheme cytochrome c family protein